MKLNAIYREIYSFSVHYMLIQFIDAIFLLYHSAGENQSVFIIELGNIAT